MITLIPVLIRRFHAHRLKRLGHLAAYASATSDAIYRAYIEQESGHLSDLFASYPVLGRRLGTRTLLWAAAQSEMIARLNADIADITQSILGGSEPGPVTSIATSLSDFHRGGRSTAILTFSSGARVVYKPRPIGPDAALNDFLTRLNEAGAPYDFQLLAILARRDYAWTEYAEHAECSNTEEARSYYERLGAVLAVLYVLHATDYHLGNLVAHGAYPVTIDNECIMSPGHQLMMERGPAEAARENDASRHSVCSVGILPELKVGARDRCDLSVLGSYDTQRTGVSSAECCHTNSDAMALTAREAVVEPEANVPRLKGEPVYANAYTDEIIRGFSGTYRFIAKLRDEADEPSRLLDPFRGIPTRLIVRNSQAYKLLFTHAGAPSRQRNGLAFSVSLEHLARVYLNRETVDGSWPLLAAERCAMVNEDIPVFRMCSDKTKAIDTDCGMRASGLIQRSGHEEAVNRLVELSEYDLEWQIRLIRAALRTGPSARKRDDRWPVMLAPDGEICTVGGTTGPGQTRRLLATHALALARIVAASAVEIPSGTVTWIAPSFDPGSRRTAIRPVGRNLYSGVAGIGVFFAAVAAMGLWDGAAALARAALEPVRSRLAQLGEAPVMTDGIADDIGAGTGLSSEIYGLLRAGLMLGEPELVQEAEHAVRAISPAGITADEHLDLVRGAAGALVVLLAVHRVTGSSDALEKAHLCGEHLLTRYQHSNGGHWAWCAGHAGPRRTGFAHGAVGIGYALARLYEVSREEAFRKGAQEAFAAEWDGAGLLKGPARMRPRRAAKTGREETDEFLGTWCNGSPGIALGLAAALGPVDTEEMRSRMNRAVSTTIAVLRKGTHERDYDLCCGALGRIECLLSAGQQAGRGNWIREAEIHAAHLIDAAGAPGSPPPFFAETSDIWPGVGFHQGLSGIGYELLRLAYPSRFGSVLLWE